MTEEILSDVYIIKKSSELNISEIESILNDKFGEIIRWAIVEAVNDDLKISVSYKKQKV